MEGKRVTGLAGLGSLLGVAPAAPEENTEPEVQPSAAVVQPSSPVELFEAMSASQKMPEPDPAQVKGVQGLVAELSGQLKSAVKLSENRPADPSVRTRGAQTLDPMREVARGLPEEARSIDHRAGLEKLRQILSEINRVLGYPGRGLSSLFHHQMKG